MEEKRIVIFWSNLFAVVCRDFRSAPDVSVSYGIVMSLFYQKPKITNLPLLSISKMFLFIFFGFLFLKPDYFFSFVFWFPILTAHLNYAANLVN